MDIKDHPLSLKVMRLTQPSLFTGVSVSCDSRDLPGDIFLKEALADMAVPQPDTGIGQVLLLPQSFGNIYLGETFSCCVCIHNHSSEMFDASLKTVLQMNNQCIALFESGPEGCQLHPDGLISKIVHHEVKEIGTHILVCAVNYKNPSSGLESSFRKFFKFQVMKPLDVKTKFYNAESDDVYLEAGIQNITAGPMFLEKVSLEPSPYYAVTSLNDLIGEDEQQTDSVFGPVGVLNQADVRQYLFCLRPTQTPNKTSEGGGTKQTANIGKLDIVWRTNMGGKGRLQTSQLQRMILPSQYSDIKLSLENLPNIVRVEEPVLVKFRISNVSERPLSLYLDFMPSGIGTEWHCFNSKQLDILEPSESLLLSAWLMPLKLGLQTIAGIRLTDTFLKRNYEYENLAQVFVLQLNGNEQLIPN